jgi:two-component system sensor histidine kinase HydH
VLLASGMPLDTKHAGRMVAFQSLPVATLLLRGDTIVAVNAAYERFMGVTAESVEGRTVSDLIGQFVGAADAPLVGAAASAQQSGMSAEGELWIRVNDASGRARSIRVDWRPSGNPDESVIYLVDAEGETAARGAAEGLARAAGQLGRCSDEREVLERAADVLHGRGLIVTTLLLRDGDPLLEYGPMRSQRSPEAQAAIPAFQQLKLARPKREVLWQINKDFHLRRAAFFQDVAPLIAVAYPGELGDNVLRHVPTRRTVQAPLFVNDVPYGALVLTGDELSPALAGSLEMFAELVARAIENVRLRTELVQRERLAALGEAAAVMAHEVRNPIAAILNADALLRKTATDATAQVALLRVIGEEALRLERLVSDLLDLGRPLMPRVRKVDLHEFTEASVRVLGARGAAGEIPVIVLAPTEKVVADIDPELAQLALWNVIRNAAQASPRGKRVTVRAEARGSQAALVVDDEGRGFPSEQVERLLEPFHTTRATGTGIGLAVVRRVVDACRGTIEIGASPGGGGRFVMVFPGGSGEK